MSRPYIPGTSSSTSPDPGSHARTIYDDPSGEADWFDEEDDDDMDFEPAAEESEDNEFFDPIEEADAAFFGMCRLSLGSYDLQFDQPNAKLDSLISDFPLQMPTTA